MGSATGRLEALSDGVFAIAVTLLILDHRAAGRRGAHLRARWQGCGRHTRDTWPASRPSGNRLGHNAITEYLERVDAVFVRLNLLLLLVVAFLPFPTRLFADYIGQKQQRAHRRHDLRPEPSCWPRRCCWSCGGTPLHAGLVRPDAEDEEIQLLTQRLTPGLGGYVVLIIAGIFVPIIAESRAGAQASL